jgi:lysophospholipase L1-like esterase
LIQRRTVVFAVITVSIALAIPVAVTEVALRLLKSDVAYQPDPDLIRSLVPSVAQVAQTWDDDENLNGGSADLPSRSIPVASPTNAAGLRMTREVGAKAPGEKRILLMGDSFTEAVNVQPETRFADRLDAALAARQFPDGIRWTVVNGGIQNGTPSQYVLQLRRWLPQFNPDVVVVMLAPNDLFDDTKFEHEYGFVFNEQGLPVSPRARTKLWILQRSYLARYLEVAISRLGPGPHDVLFRPATSTQVLDWKPLLCAGDPEMERQWVGKTGHYLLGLRDMTEAAGARFAVLMIHYMYEFDDEPWYRELYPGLEADLRRLGCRDKKGGPYREFVGGFLSTNRIRYRDSYDALLRAKAENPKRKLWGLFDYHFSPAGHRVIADELSELLDPLLVPTPEPSAVNAVK